MLAYLDPGSGGLIVQAVLGGVAGLAVAVKAYGRRLVRRNAPLDDAGEQRPEAGTEAPADAKQD